ncbi:GNAT family N-acetyltransferase [Maridesulfovibrio ferrireducens]|uniref:GNAT family N-acetyltransferase n=1 Tax=Maridesulfovibrio ferrireducens TaxID=246191 RepID=UPI001A2E32F6|nr:GNAT family N-acetyltransferase [Maridesulfovibrio ferrireducens]MBI9109597.1 GNAT family N-acetyltransferase [Maridesulfovibrio ferrireducens]
MTIDIIEDEKAAPAEESEIQLKLSLGLQAKEAEEVLQLAGKCQNFSPNDLMLAEEIAWEAAFGTEESSRTFIKAHVINDDEQILVGFVCFGTIPDEEDCYELYLVAVDDAYQGIGIGSALLDEVDRQVSMDNGSMIFCEIPEHRSLAPVHYFFEALGYDRQSQYYRFFVPSQGNLVYAREVEQFDDEN